MNTWVLLRGLMRETRHWGAFIGQLQAQYPDDHIVCIEWPGNGRLHDKDSLASVELMADYVQRSLINQGHNGPYHVIAISLGAMAAVAWAYQQPTHIASCTLINTSLRPFNSATERLAARNWPRVLQLLAASPQQREAIILGLSSNHSDEATLAQWQQYATQYPISLRNSYRQLRAASRYQAQSMPPAVPLLLLNSAADRLVQPVCSLAIAQAWQCPLQTHPSAGHDLCLDDGDWVLVQIATQFFKKLE